jgi:hypothetical protein
LQSLEFGVCGRVSVGFRHQYKRRASEFSMAHQVRGVNASLP